MASLRREVVADVIDDVSRDVSRDVTREVVRQAEDNAPPGVVDAARDVARLVPRGVPPGVVVEAAEAVEAFVEVGGVSAFIGERSGSPRDLEKQGGIHGQHRHAPFDDRASGAYKQQSSGGPVGTVDLTSGKASHKNTELGLLVKNKPRLATRIGRLNLTDQERDFICSVHHQHAATIEDGVRSKRIGNVFFLIQALSSAVVPVLVGMVGQSDDPAMNNLMKIIAIVISILGTISKTIEDVFHFRAYGIKVQGYTDSWLDEFASFEALSGDSYKGNSYAEFNTHSGAAFKEFAESSTLLSKTARHGIADLFTKSEKK